jgi:hypothetical protein
MRLVGSPEFYPIQGFTDEANPTPKVIEDNKQIWGLEIINQEDPTHSLRADYVISRDGKWFLEDFYILPNGNGINPSAKPEELVSSIKHTFHGRVRLAPNLTPDMVASKAGLQEDEVRFHIRQAVQVVLDEPVRTALLPS